MDNFKLTIERDGKLETVEAVAVILFEVADKQNIRIHMLDKSEIPDEWWRLVVTRMYKDLDNFIKSRKVSQIKGE